jgi:hypothetical protein
MADYNLDKRQLYRLPWSTNDNPVAWLEISDLCNITCGACYRKNLDGHKSLNQIKEEILFFKRSRNPDSISIAGGEPLLHPEIVKIVAFIKEQGMKPLILSNGLRLNECLLIELKHAGLTGIVIHIDRMQKRPRWNNKSEAELNSLRQEFVDLIASVGGLCTFFIATVYPETVNEICEIVKWAQSKPDQVQGLIFVACRTISKDGQSGVAANSKIDMSELVYSSDTTPQKYITNIDIYRVIKESCPGYEVSSYLGSTVVNDAYKWTIAVTMGTRQRIYGSIGKSSMEIAQILHHLAMGTYILYGSFPVQRNGFFYNILSVYYQALAEYVYLLGKKVFLLGLFDTSVRNSIKLYLQDVMKNPNLIFEKIHIQGIIIIQPPDQLPDGRFDACDGCPDMTVFNNELVTSCRMDEYRIFGGPVTMSKYDEPKSD